jgi:hypothetical protein
MATSQALDILEKQQLLAVVTPKDFHARTWSAIRAPIRGVQQLFEVDGEAEPAGLGTRASCS